MPTSVPEIEFTSTGVVIPDESDVLEGVQADQNSAFGGNLSSALETPQGQLASSLAAIIGDKNDQIAWFIGNVDPDIAEGIMQDAIARIYFLTRRPAIATTVDCQCTGLAGTYVPVGALVADGSGNIFSSTQAGTIPEEGVTTLAFACTETGPVAVASGSVNRIYQAIPGWDAVINTANGIPGSDVESRADFEYRRKNSVAINGRGTLASIYANVFAVDNVIDVYAYENNTGEAITAGPTYYELAPHSIYVAVKGGITTEVAEAIWRSKDCGSNYNGNTEVTVTDNSGYNYPYPMYIVKYHDPSEMPVLFEVRLVNNPKLPSDIIDQVKAAIIAAFNGLDGGSRARIGAEIVSGRFYAGVAAISNHVAILSIMIGTSGPDQTLVRVGIDQFPTVTAEDITVTLV